MSWDETTIAIMAIATNTYKRLRGHGRTVLERHQHTNGYLAVVVSGGYEKAGDRGRFRVQAGDVICHEAFEAHLNRYNSVGADLIVLPAPTTAEFPSAVGGGARCRCNSAAGGEGRERNVSSSNRNHGERAAQSIGVLPMLLC